MSKTNSKFIQFYFRHRGLCLTVISLLVVFFVFRTPHVAKAASDAETTDLIKSINEIIILIMRISSAWLWPVLLMIGSLLDNDLIFGGAMGERLLSIWVQIRNLVNVVFVLILLAIAIYNVMGLGEEGGTLPLAFKTVMPKFVLALIAVNFSFLGAKVVLDFTNVITGAVFALPANISGNSDKMQGDFKNMICGTKSNEVPMKPLWCDKGELNDRAINFFSRLDRNNITLAYAVQFGRAPNLKFIKDGLKDISQLGFNIIFNTVLYVVYSLSFIALLLVLLFRTVALWIGVVLSPLLALTIVLPNLKELAGSGGELKDQFVKNAIAPIKIGLVLSIGYIMLEGFSADKGIHGEILSSSVLTSIDPNSLPTDITDLQQLMIAVGVIVIVWMGVFSAADETAAKSITGFIREKAQTFGTFAAKLPTYAQVIPTGMAEHPRATLAEIGATLENIPGLAREKFGSSLLGNRDQLKPITLANNKRDLGKGVAQVPQVLATEAGWEAFKKKLVELELVKKEDLEKMGFKDKYETSTGGMRKIFSDDQFREMREGIKAQDEALTDFDKLNQAVRTKPEEKEEKKPITDADSAKAALVSDRSADDLHTEKAFGDWSVRQLEEYKKLPDGVKSTFNLTWSGDKANIDLRLLNNVIALKELDGKPSPTSAEITEKIGAIPDTTLKAIQGTLSTDSIKQAITAKTSTTGTSVPPAPAGGAPK